MCTISWIRSSDRLDLFFNRDELLTRPDAFFPIREFMNGIQVIYPLDPQGGGTWMAATSKGLVFALLNYYPEGISLDTFTESRGQFLRSLLSVSSLSELQSRLPDRVHTRPFFLYAFDLHSALFITWDGRSFTSDSNVPDCGFLSTSSYCSSPVSAYRHSLFNDFLALTSSPALDDFYRLHAMHCDEDLPYGICMHRDNGYTVSFSHLSLLQETLQFDYFSGPPCQKQLPCRATLFLNSEVV